ncbi:MAG: LysR family transcriptional regulator [Bdellovibrionales bacterium]
MELNHLRYFYEVAKFGSFTEAARRLHVSQSAISKAVKLLEDAEGVQLLKRSKKGVTLTAVGQNVYIKAECIFRTLVEIENTCRGTKEVCEGYLRFGASDHLLNYYLVNHLRDFQKRYPKVVGSVFAGTPNDIIDLMLRNELEFGLFFTRVNIPQIRYEELFSAKMAVVCHPELLAKSQRRHLKTALKEAGFIGSIKSQYQHHPSTALTKLIDQDLATAFESNSQEAQKRFCLLGGGIAFLARFMVEKELQEGSLIELSTRKPLNVHLLLALRRGRDLSLVAKTYLDQLRALSL